MLRVIVATAAALSVACVVHAHESTSGAAAPPSEGPMGSSSQPSFTSPGATVLLPGDRAPQFSYLDERGHWRGFGALRAGRAVLLFFGARAADLAAIENRRPEFQKLGIAPVAVLDLGARSVAAWTRRYEYPGAVINDPKGAIAGLFNTVDPTTHRHAPSFFVLDERGAIRSVWHGPLPDADRLLAEATRSLGRTRDDAPMGVFEER